MSRLPLTLHVSSAWAMSWRSAVTRTASSDWEELLSPPGRAGLVGERPCAVHTS